MSDPHRKSLGLKEGRLSLLEWPGSGPTFHFAHANGFNAQTYSQLLAPLGGRFSVLASDARGHGLTDLPTVPGSAKGWDLLARDLAETLEQLPAGPIVLAGHSLGGITSMMVAAARPDRVRGLILVEPVLVPEKYPGPGPALAVMTRKRRDRFASLEDALNSYRGRGAFASWPEGVLRDYLEGGLLPADDGVRLACSPAWEAEIYADNPVGAAQLASKVNCPITVLYGDTNSTAPDSEVKFIAQHATARIVKIPGASHFLPMEKPEVVREEIARMMETANL